MLGYTRSHLLYRSRPLFPSRICEIIRQRDVSTRPQQTRWSPIQASRNRTLTTQTTSGDRTPEDAVKLILYNNWLSSCSARLRIALNLLNVPYTYVPVNTKAGEHHLPHHRALNPNLSVPTLVAERASGDEHVIGQSWAALEWLCETRQSSPSLMPEDPAARARVRELCMIFVADTQPLTTTRVKKRVDDLGGDMGQWRRFWFRRGLDAYDGAMNNGPRGIRAGKYSVGDEITLADCVLVPAVWKCEIEELGPNVWGNDLPLLKNVYGRVMEMEEVKKAHWRSQVDTPEGQRTSI